MLAAPASEILKRPGEIPSPDRGRRAALGKLRCLVDFARRQGWRNGSLRSPIS
jgi:hypothetical protein